MKLWWKYCVPSIIQSVFVIQLTTCPTQKWVLFSTNSLGKWILQSKNNTYRIQYCVGFQIILSTILAIQNNNHTQKHKYLREKPFLLEGKNHGTNSKQFHCYQINYNNSCVCFRLNKNLSYFSLLSQTQIFFLKGNNPFIFSFFTMGTHIFLFTVRCLFFLLVCVSPFSTPRACLFYIEFCRLTLLGTFGVLTFHVSPISSWNRSPHQLGLAR